MGVQVEPEYAKDRTSLMITIDTNVLVRVLVNDPKARAMSTCTRVNDGKC